VVRDEAAQAASSFFVAQFLPDCSLGRLVDLSPVQLCYDVGVENRYGVTILHRTTGIIAVALIITAAGAGGWLLFRRGHRPAVSRVTTRPTSLAASQPSTKPAKTPPPRTYMDVVLATHPGFPTTQPLGSPLDLREAARLTFDDPIHLDQVLNLWITRADAEPTNVVLKTTADETSHVLRERVAFVHRWPDDKGVWQTMLVVRKPGGAGYELVRTSARQDLGNAQEYLWDRAFSWNVEGNSSIVVPTKSGVSIIRPDRRPLELYHEFKVESKGELGEPQVLLDWRGIIAWIPWENGRAGSNGAIRFVGDHWIDLDSSVGWPKKLVHLVPLLDGSILRVATKEDETAEVSLATLDAAEVDERIITDLVDQLSDPDPDKRTAAFAELTRYGNGVWPLLERLAPDQPPEAKRRIEELLGVDAQGKPIVREIEPD
jgi:hypothetical protein